MSRFLMKPKIDFAFKEIMTDADARKGFLSAILKLDPSDIRDTRILNTFLDYYDMKLKDDAFENLEITLSPSATESQETIVRALVDKYAHKAKIKESSLGKVVRLK